MVSAFLQICSELKGFKFDTNKIQSMRIFQNSEKDKPRIVVILYVGNCCIVRKSEHVEKIIKKLRKEFKIV